MQRREFHKRAISGAVLVLLGTAGCGGGGGAAAPAAPDAGPGSAGGAIGPGGDPGGVADPLALAPVATLGTNLSGMEWAGGVRISDATAPNLDFTVPRAAEVRWLATRGFARTGCRSCGSWCSRCWWTRPPMRRHAR